LEAGVLTVVVRETELEAALSALKTPPRMVITDSQAFGVVSKIVPESVELTSFSILFARYKGDLATVIGGAAKLSHLKDGDKVLISEGCTHHRQCKDIGTVKLPDWINNYTGKNISYSFTSGTEFPEDLSQYALVVHCGGCMLNEKEMKSRLERCNEQCVPVTNYGIAIAQMHGILKRSLVPFPDLLNLLEQ
jgi:[FeFe] hydrogenase H-cluster maturation GTPase HydF